MPSPELVSHSTDVAPLRGLSELAALANAEHRATIEHLESAVRHAITCGEALLDARRQIPHGGWEQWMDDNLLMGAANARVYMRLAECQDLIGDATSIRVARRTIAALAPGIEGGRAVGRHLPMDANLTNDARRLRAQGLSYDKIAELLGISTSTVKYRIDGKTRMRNLQYSRRRKAESRNARRALERERRDRAVKAKGGASAEAYALLRRCAQQLDEALGSTHDGEERAALRSSLSWVHRAEDDIVRALRIERTIRDLPVTT